MNTKACIVYRNNIDTYVISEQGFMSTETHVVIFTFYVIFDYQCLNI